MIKKVMVAQPKPIPQQTISQGFGFIFRIWCYRFGEKVSD
jgi:hypothetical protein